MAQTPEERRAANARRRRAHHQRNKDDPEYREGMARRKREYQTRLRNNVFEAYGDACACCGETERLFLLVDHKDGGGNRHREALTGKKHAPGATQYVYREIRKRGYPPEFQLLCANCSLAKDRGGCLHQKD